jgi:multimeric flavodoxin WrbA
MRKIIILGSSNSKGHTKKALETLMTLADFDLIDLNEYNIGFYDYQHRNAGDDYLPLIKKIISQYDLLIFATPVYWYSMSAVMKVFFDRFTDLLDSEKDLGRKLRNKSMAVLTSSVGDHLEDRFWIPFKETANYLGMNYIGNVHTIENKVEMNDLKTFVDTLNRCSYEDL